MTKNIDDHRLEVDIAIGKHNQNILDQSNEVKGLKKGLDRIQESLKHLKGVLFSQFPFDRSSMYPFIFLLYREIR